MALKRRAPDAPPDFFPGFADVVEIGSGSLSTVYRARELATGRWLALKLFNVRDAPSDALTAFERDTTAVTALADHPNIVALHGSFRVDSDDRPVQILELCPTSVAALLKQSGAVPVRDVVSLGVKIAGALESAHRAQVLHRDVKPQNILVTQSGQPALVDFGVAALRPTAAVTATRAGMTVLHTGPELLERGEATPATDVYELAATLYHLITGRGAFRAEPGEQPAAVIGRIVRDAVPPLSAQQAPPRLSALLLAAMSKDPADRPATAAEFATELGAIEGAHRWPRTDFVVRDLPSVPPAPSAAPAGWTPPPAAEWFPAEATPPPAAPALASTEWSEPTRSTPRHARPDDDEADEAYADEVADEADKADKAYADEVEEEPEVVAPAAETADQYAAFEAAAVHAPPTTVNPIMPATQSAPDESQAGDSWSDVSLSAPARPRPSPTPSPVPPVEQPSATVDPVNPAYEIVDPGVTTAHPLWRQERAAAAAEAAAAAPAPAMPDEPADATVQHVVPPELSDVNDTVARYPIRPPGPAEGEQAPAAVPAWVYREPEQSEAAGASYGDDLTIDPMSLRRRVTLRAGGHALVVDDTRLVVRAWLHRSEIAWPDVLGFEPRFDGVGASGSGGQLVALTRSGPVELPATKRSMADLLYVHALLDAYRHRAQM